MSRKQRSLATVLCLTVATALFQSGASADHPWIALEGTQGIGAKKHVVLISGDEEYRSEEAMPMLAKILSKRFGFRCTVLFAIHQETGEIDPNVTDNIPGLSALKTADLMMVFTRFRALPDEQMKHIDAYLQTGKPIIGIRPSVVAFRNKPDSKFAKYSSNYQGDDFHSGFGRQVLGATWISHHGHHGHESTRGIPEEEMSDHPILRGVEVMWGPTDVYTVRTPIPHDGKILVMGQVVQGMKSNDPPSSKPQMPLAWIKHFPTPGGDARVFMSTMGDAQDFQDDNFRRMIVNACLWAVGLEDAIGEKINVETIVPYEPSPFGFNAFRKGLFPRDYAHVEAKPGEPEQDEAYRRLTALEPGQGLEVVNFIRQAVVRSRTDERVRTDLEARLIGVLQGDATDLAKDYACRQLAIVGSDTSIPVLAELLPAPRMSYMARYAMEGIGSPAAIQMLREMLGKTYGRQKVGVVISLGRLADGTAVPELSALLGEEDDELRKVAVVALGRIGTVPAADALRAFADNAPEELSHLVVSAELQATESLCRNGEYQAAVELCESLLSADSERVRAAAFRGLISAKPRQSLALILAGLAAEEPWKRAVAADCVVELEQPEEIKTIASAVPELPVPGKIAALVSLKDRCDPAVRKAALLSLDHADAEVHVAALATLIASGTAEDAPTLTRLASMAEDARVRDAAYETLRLMTADGTNKAVSALLTETKTLNPAVVRCALARRSPEFVPSFLKAAESSDASTRLEAFKALEIMATENEAELLADLLRRTAPGAEREAAGRAVWMSCRRIPDPTLRSTPLLAAMEKADVSGQCAILPSLARLGGEQSLATVHEAMHSNDQAVRDAGYRALANWPDATVADQLLEIAKTSEVKPYRIWSLRAYGRVVSLPGGRPPQEAFEMLNSAMELAIRTEDRELFVSRLGSVRVPDALTLLLSLLDDEELQTCAVPAIFTLAKGLSQSRPDQAKTALERIQSMTKDAAILQQIPRVIRDIETRKQGQKE